jgi:hypothetical protein
MSAKTMHRLNRALTRSGFEKLLQERWMRDDGDPSRRLGGTYRVSDDGNHSLVFTAKWETYYHPKDKKLKCVKNLKTGSVRTGRTWRELADSLGLGKVI